MHESLSSVYATRVAQYLQAQQKNTRQLGFISFSRLVLFLIFAWFLYTAFSERFQNQSLIVALLIIPLFLLLVFFAGKLKDKNAFFEQLIRINNNELTIPEGKPSFLDDGIAFAEYTGFASDLNIFGAGSLFHLLNRAGSTTGKERLGARLSNPLLQPADIRNYQVAIQELSTKMDFRQQLLAHTLLLNETETIAQLKSAIPEDGIAILKNKFWSFFAIVWPIAGMVVTICALWEGRFQLILSFVILGLLLLSFIQKKLSAVYHHISKRSYLFSQYAICFQMITDQSFENPFLQHKQKEIILAANAFKKLARVASLFDLRMNLLSIFINGLFLFDLLCAREYLQWNKKYQAEISKWFDTLGEIELLNSIATFRYNHPRFIFPQPEEQGLFIEATGMGHPLMNETKAVVNNISIGHQGKLHLITGSNMSGKSTFLRTLGLNIILAQVGAPVFAGSFVFRPVRVLTSFHHIDSLSENTSYFYAELKSLQTIIQSIQQSSPSLVLLDEVMRGTNSKDKHDGTALLIKRILEYSCLTLIATHDTELGILAKTYPGEIENFCFESELSDNGLRFDFKKRTGVAQSTNATYLMQQMGIV